MINLIQSDPNPPDPNHPIPNRQENAKDIITMINSIQSDPNLPDPNHPIPNRQEKANACSFGPVNSSADISSSQSGHPSTDVMVWAPADPVP